MARSAPNLLLAAAILSGGGVSGSADGQETETDGSRSACQSPSLTDAPSRLARHSLGDGGNPIAGLRGGSAARSPISPDIGKRVESPRIEENKAISQPSAVGVTVAAAASGEWSEFIPILPADVASLSGGSQAAGGQSVTLFRSLGSKTDPVLHVRFPAPWSVVAENRRIPNWRRLLPLVRTSVLGDE
ncbi:hypothetical protein [Kiritimatiella glycovorans]|uniref:hypothetical protein n=1 Tax=Kiritimatiella glycovorans TaxID=1307763 RepID=UPI00069A575F|nr:hypothetical protein [Kiritimatiella glycovorans]